MRSRFILLVLAILLVAGFAALNWAEIIRPTSVWFGPFIADAPLGAILLGLLALSIVVFAVAAATMRTQTLLESRHHYKELEAQRLLADKAEASRFTELRTHIDTHLRELRERDAIAASEFERQRLENQRALGAQLEQINRTLAARLNELEHRLESRFERMGVARGPVVGTPAAGHEPMAGVTAHEQAPALSPATDAVKEQQAHQAQMREEQRLRAERERERDGVGTGTGTNPGTGTGTSTGTDRPAESGWRRWF